MNKTYKALLICIALHFSCICLGQQGNNSNDTLKNVIREANTNLVEFLEKGVSKTRENNYGFKNREELKIAQAGTPYRRYTLNRNFFEDLFLTNFNYLVEHNKWMVPIKINEEYRALLEISLINNEYKKVGLSQGIAKDLAEIEKSYLDSNQIRMILFVGSPRSDFILYRPDPGNNELSAIPTSAAKRAFSLPPDSKIEYKLDSLYRLIKANQ